MHALRKLKKLLKAGQMMKVNITKRLDVIEKKIEAGKRKAAPDLIMIFYDSEIKKFVLSERIGFKETKGKEFSNLKDYVFAANFSETVIIDLMEHEKLPDGALYTFCMAEIKKQYHIAKAAPVSLEIAVKNNEVNIAIIEYKENE